MRHSFRRKRIVLQQHQAPLRFPSQHVIRIVHHKVKNHNIITRLRQYGKVK